ncbi:hypothetical protein [Maribacter sp. HTCC2170]|uniref:hypothetical protein n=1 Tax=Maribacter sp. (strain HTCC2170 / KCCM 42371) TaxID=313603 RepID=UPI00006AFCD1|nr:hypothetical protein [Maribacter sp. HTCC2170]EAR01185.1 hypothetical protein FB2170_10711 [Maribacter sp. HTCC2170]
MKLFRQKDFIAILSILLIVFLFTPTIVKLSHALNEHKHFVCEAVGELHLHEVELDCDFQDFNLSPQFSSSLTEAPDPLTVHNPKEITSQYTFLSKYQKLHFALRGPPIAS